MKTKTLTILLFLLPLAGWTQSEFVGRYKRVQPSELSIARNISIDACEDAPEIEIVYDKEQNQLYAEYGRENWVTMLFEDIGKGRKSFNSCWSDGTLGYSETTAKPNQLKTVTVYQEAGFLCSGGSEKKRLTEELTLKSNILTYRYYWNSSSPSNFKCTFEKVE